MGEPIDVLTLSLWREEAEEWDEAYPADTRNHAAIQARRVLALLAEVARLDRSLR